MTMRLSTLFIFSLSALPCIMALCTPANTSTTTVSAVPTATVIALAGRAADIFRIDLPEDPVYQYSELKITWIGSTCGSLVSVLTTKAETVASFPVDDEQRSLVWLVDVPPGDYYLQLSRPSGTDRAVLTVPFPILSWYSRLVDAILKNLTG